MIFVKWLTRNHFQNDYLIRFLCKILSLSHLWVFFFKFKFWNKRWQTFPIIKLLIKQTINVLSFLSISIYKHISTITTKKMIFRWLNSSKNVQKCTGKETSPDLFFSAYWSDKPCQEYNSRRSTSARRDLSQTPHGDSIVQRCMNMAWILWPLLIGF